jgi:hypothetical protein
VPAGAIEDHRGMGIASDLAADSLLTPLFGYYFAPVRGKFFRFSTNFSSICQYKTLLKNIKYNIV